MILDTVAKKGSVASVQYAGIFAEKDKRTSELLAAIFFKTFVEGSEALCDAFDDNGASCEELYHLLPRFR
eukprot:9249154-Pyramimonas_sp.AAC.1